MQNVTAVTVVCNTFGLFFRMYKAFRKFYPDMKLIVVDNSDRKSSCRQSLKQYISGINEIIFLPGNIGHGKALNRGIAQVKTPYVLIMDSDTEILKNPLPEMIRLMDPETYGVGCITAIGRDGYDFMTFQHHKVPIRYLHPFFALINVEMFRRYKQFVHHGAPWYKTAVQIHDQMEGFRIKNFDGLRAFDRDPKGILIAARTEYVFHDFGGTRRKLKSMGMQEINGPWER